MSFKQILSGLVLSLLIGSGFVANHIYKDQYQPYKREKEKLERFTRLQVLEKGLGVLHNWWRNGPPELSRWQTKCPNKLGSSDNVDLSYYRCNPAAIECALNEGVDLKVVHNKKTYLLTLDKVFRDNLGKNRRYYPLHYASLPLDKSYPEGAIFQIRIDDEIQDGLKVTLGDTCSSSYLPKRIYPLGRMEKKKKDWLWDNLSRNYFLDRFQVSNRKILDWIEFHNGPERLKEKVKENVLAAPATYLNAEDMELYCASYGKRVLTAQLFDAATFHPEDQKKSKYIYRSKFPEGGRNSEHFLGKYKKGKITNFNSKHCEKIYGLECFKVRPFVHHSRGAVSWSGIFQILGGYPEYLPNLVRPRKNLKASSFYLPMSSEWHQLGYRAYWNGKNFIDRSFTGLLFPPIDKDYEVAFRCFREVYDE